MFKAVIFDIDNTLYSYDLAHKSAFQALIEYVIKELPMEPHTFKMLHKKMDSELKEYMGDVAAVHNRLIRYQNILEYCALPLYPHAVKMYNVYWGTFLENIEPFSGVPETLEILKSAGIRLGIGTDMTVDIQFQKLERLDLLKYIDFIVSSEEVGAEKPDRKFFDRCLSKSKCQAEECVFVGDNYIKDVLGSVAAGMRGVWYHPEKTKEVTDTEQIRDMMQLLDLVFCS